MCGGCLSGAYVVLFSLGRHVGSHLVSTICLPVLLQAVHRGYWSLCPVASGTRVRARYNLDVYTRERLPWVGGTERERRISCVGVFDANPCCLCLTVTAPTHTTLSWYVRELPQDAWFSGYIDLKTGSGGPPVDQPL